MTARDAAAESRRLALPQAPDKYELKLPGDFKAPDGIDFKLNTADPLLAQAREVMFDIDQGKISGQDAFSKLLGLYAGSQIASQAAIKAARDAEVGKLGANGPARVTALETGMKAALGVADGQRFMARMFTADDIAMGEKLLQRLISGGSGSHRGTGREPPERQGKTAEQIAAMSPAERLDYTRGRSNEQKMPDWKDPHSAAA